MLSTGVPNLDLILGGGLPEGSVMLVSGPAGTGKTTITMQMAFHLASQGHNILYISTLSEPPTRLIEHARNFAFFDESLIGRNLFFLSVYPLVKQSLDKLFEELMRFVNAHKAVLVVVDGLMTIHDLHPEIPSVRTFVYDLGASLAAFGTTTVITTSTVMSSEGRPYPELTMTDSILDLSTVDFGTQTFRAIRAAKMRGQAPLLGQHSMKMDAQGVTIFPRIESIVGDSNIGLSQKRVPLGLPELDQMMHGGPLAGGTTVLTGALGTGKTLTCLEFLAEGVRRGEKSLFVGFRESPDQLLDKAAVFGFDMKRAIADGLVSIVYLPQVDLVVDQVSWEIVRTLDSFKLTRVAIDSVTELEQAMIDFRRQRGYMFALANLMRQKGVTSLITKEIPQIVGPELDFSDTPLAMLAENLILMRYVEFRGELYRIVSVLKMRDSEHDTSIRQYTINERGLTVLTRLEAGEGVLTGIARLPGELRVRRGGRSGPSREELT